MTAVDHDVLEDIVLPAPHLWARTQAERLAALVQLLSSHHKGRAAGITAEHLALALCMNERMLRMLISTAREQGIAIGGRPETGYFIVATAEELEDTCAFLHGRALHSLRIEAQLRRCSLADLLGQMRLPT